MYYLVSFHFLVVCISSVPKFVFLLIFNDKIYPSLYYFLN